MGVPACTVLLPCKLSCAKFWLFSSDLFLGHLISKYNEYISENCYFEGTFYIRVKFGQLQDAEIDPVVNYKHL